MAPSPPADGGAGLKAATARCPRRCSRTAAATVRCHDRGTTRTRSRPEAGRGRDRRPGESSAGSTCWPISNNSDSTAGAEEAWTRTRGDVARSTGAMASSAAGAAPPPVSLAPGPWPGLHSPPGARRPSRASGDEPGRRPRAGVAAPGSRRARHPAPRGRRAHRSRRSRDRPRRTRRGRVPGAGRRGPREGRLPAGAAWPTPPRPDPAAGGSALLRESTSRRTAWPSRWLSRMQRRLAGLEPGPLRLGLGGQPGQLASRSSNRSRSRSLRSSTRLNCWCSEPRKCSARSSQAAGRPRRRARARARLPPGGPITSR